MFNLPPLSIMSFMVDNRSSLYNYINASQSLHKACGDPLCSQ